MATARIEKVTPSWLVSEGPFWDEHRKVLYYVDIFNATIHKYDPATGKDSAVKINEGLVSFVIPLEGKSNEFAINVNKNLAILTWDGESPEPQALKIGAQADNEKGKEQNLINDCKVDCNGILWGGIYAPLDEATKKFIFKKGSIYSFRDGIPKIQQTDFILPNGLDWSLDNKTFFLNDSGSLTVEAFDYHPDEMKLTNRRTIFDFKKSNLEGMPDGMAIDKEDKLWIACFGAGKVIRIDPTTGQLLKKLAVPANQVTSLAFGGPGCSELYVTSARVDLLYPPLADTFPDTGAVFRVSGLGVSGLPGRRATL